MTLEELDRIIDNCGKEIADLNYSIHAHTHEIEVDRMVLEELSKDLKRFINIREEKLNAKNTDKDYD